MSKDISEYTSAELYKLAAEKQEQEFLTLRPKAINFEDITEEDVKKLISLAESCIEDEESVREVDTHCAYEALMKFVYGNKVWDYVNGLGG